MKRPDEYDDFEFDVREDEEQGVKLSQTVDLLLAAGYFRARIHGLSPFDKVVGGMTWCISTCNYDVDVDLLFQENSTIGQKIALTEKIVAVLPRMKCPHHIEPHQIQGLDFIHIFPVVQWLVKKAIETREEMGDYVRAYSISQFDKYFTMPQDVEFKETKVKAIEAVDSLKTAYGPKRRYKRQESSILEEEARVQSTLLEYGRKGDLGAPSQQKKGADKDKPDSKEAKQAEKERLEEERRIQSLMEGMAAMEGPQGKLTASAVGSIMGLQSEQIQQIASEYADKQSELAALEPGEHTGGIQQHQRQTASLNKQIQQQQKRLTEIEQKHAELQQGYEETQRRLQQVETQCAELDHQMAELSELETEENQGVLQTLRSLVAMNESLKRQEKEFRDHCKEELGRLQANLDDLKQHGGLDTEDPEQMQMIDRQYRADREKLQKIRLLLAAKNREIAGLQRKIDEVPSRAELSQYQRRFVELYNQVAAKHKETKQFYTLYNTLDDTKLYLNKEVSLLNSIHDTFEQAMASAANKEQFLKQLEQIVEGVKQNRNKVEKRKQEEKMRRDQLNDDYLHLVDQQRIYFKTVKEFKEECRRNEILMTKVKS